MNNGKWILTLTTLFLVAGQAAAQGTEERRANEARDRADREAEVSMSEAELAERMREAEEQLAEAAARIAELSAKRLDGVGNLEQYMEFRFSDKPRIGVTIESEGNDPVEGVEIIGVTPGSAGQEAGLRAGDVITSVNDEPLAADTGSAAAKKLGEFMEGVEEGDTIEVAYLREGKVGRVEVEPRPVAPEAWALALAQGMRPHPAPGAPAALVAPDVVREFVFRPQPWRGIWGNMELVELNEGLGHYFGTDKGLLVVNAPEANAFKLEDGDVILGIGGREPSSVNHCMRILGSYQPGEKLVIDIMRDKKRKTVEVEVPDDRTSRFVAPPLPTLPELHPMAPLAPAAAPAVPVIAPLPAALPALPERT